MAAISTNAPSTTANTLDLWLEFLDSLPDIIARLQNIKVSDEYADMIAKAVTKSKKIWSQLPANWFKQKPPANNSYTLHQTMNEYFNFSWSLHVIAYDIYKAGHYTAEYDRKQTMIDLENLRVLTNDIHNLCAHKSVWRIINCKRCDKQIFENTIFDHNVNQCKEVITECIYCGILMKRKNIDDHYVNRCREVITECIYCKTLMKRKNLEKHELTCDKISVSCKYCYNLVIKKDLTNHLQLCDGLYTICPKYKDGLTCITQWKRGNETKHMCTRVMPHLLDLEPVKYVNGYYVDALDRDGHWYPAQIFDINKLKRTYTLKFLYWPEKFNEVDIPFDADRLMPFTTITRNGLYLGRCVYANNKKYKICKKDPTYISLVNIHDPTDFVRDSKQINVNLRLLMILPCDVDVDMVFCTRNYGSIKIISVVKHYVGFILLKDATSFYKTTHDHIINIDHLYPELMIIFG